MDFQNITSHLTLKVALKVTQTLMLYNSKTVLDRAVVTLEHEEEVIYMGFLMILSDLTLSDLEGHTQGHSNFDAL